MPSESPIPSNCGLFCGVFKSLFAKALRPSTLLPVLDLVVRASSAFPPLQSAAGGLLKIMEVVEVRYCFSLELYCSSSNPICEPENNSEQRRYQWVEEVLH